MSASFVLRGGRVIDPANGIDRIADLVIGNDKILGLDLPAIGTEYKRYYQS